MVDLDGTLTRVDTLHEQIVRAALRRPWQLLGTVPALLRSRAHFKAALSQIAPPPGPVPWNDAVLTAIRRHSGANTFVCTASNQAYAEHLCRRGGLELPVFGSDDAVNLKGLAKATFLRQRFGTRGFTYVGNERADLPVWREAAKAMVVSSDVSLVQRARTVCPAVEHLPAPRPLILASLARAVRPHQWAKNLLLFVPILTSHRFAELPLLLQGGAAFVAFCLLSSATYLLNDLVDLDADRQHRSKKFRPFASGELSVLWGFPLFVALTAAGLGLAACVSPPLGWVSGGYVVATLLYSTWIKKLALLDVYVLAGLYTLRLVAGGAATGIAISVWLAAFSIFLFLSLALCKRYAELRELPTDSGGSLRGRGYQSADTAFVLAHGLVAMGCASLVLAVYLSSETVALLYSFPALLWIAVLIVSYWGGRLWLLTARGQMHDDPVLFALRDRTSWLCLLLLLGVFFGAMLLR